MTIERQVWNHNGAHLRTHADMEHDEDGGTIASAPFDPVVELYELRERRDWPFCDDDELPMLCRLQAG